MKSYKATRNPILLQVRAGEIICVMDANRNNYQLQLNKTNQSASAVIALHQTPAATSGLPIHPNDTVLDILYNWLADAPVVSVESTIEQFGLEDALLVSFSALDQDARYRLQVLKAVLEGAPVLEFVAPWRIVGFSDFLRGVYDFVSDYSQQTGRPLPALVAYDPGYLPGLAFIADRVLEPRSEALVELLSDW